MLEDFCGYFQSISDLLKNNSLEIHDNNPF